MLTDEQEKQFQAAIKRAAEATEFSFASQGCGGSELNQIRNDMFVELSRIQGIKISASEAQMIRSYFTESIEKELASQEPLEIYGLNPATGKRVSLSEAELTELLGQSMRIGLAEYVAPKGKPAPFAFGDVIRVWRQRFLSRGYYHYGIYESDDCVYEYAGEKGDSIFGKDNVVRVTSLSKFIGDSGRDNCFALDFPVVHSRPWERVLGGSVPDKINNETETADCVNASASEQEEFKYHRYSPEETVERARKVLGEKKYGLWCNNCEHYALWCKTNVPESYQVREWWKLLKYNVEKNRI